MALINCPDCNRQVSQNAPTCPGCGAPIATKHESAGSGVAQLQTIQETSKALKSHTLVSVVLIIVGFVSMMAVANAHQEPQISLGIFIFGLIYYAITRYRIWWHHK
jgi:uncharacterized membrane protein YvbJ